MGWEEVVLGRLVGDGGRCGFSGFVDFGDFSNFDGAQNLTTTPSIT